MKFKLTLGGVAPILIESDSHEDLTKLIASLAVQQGKEKATTASVSASVPKKAAKTHRRKKMTMWTDDEIAAVGTAVRLSENDSFADITKRAVEQVNTVNPRHQHSRTSVGAKVYEVRAYIKKTTVHTPKKTVRALNTAGIYA